MKKLLIAAVVAVGVAVNSYAQTPTATSFETLTVTNAATPITAAVLVPAGQIPVSTCTFTVETADIRVRYDGSDPTSSVGHLIPLGQSFRLAGANNLAAFRAIRTAGTNAGVTVSCASGASTNPSPLELLTTPASTVDLSGSSFSGNSAADVTGGVVPADASYTGINVGGTLTGLTAGQTTMANSIPVVVASNQATFPVTATLAAETTKVIGTINVSAAQTIATTNAGTFAVQAAQSGTWNVTNVSGTVSLPTGASTAAKQPALGTAGTASTDVISVQGIASMTPFLVTLGAETTKAIGVVRNADGAGNLLTSLSLGSERALNVSILDGSGNQVTAFSGSGGTASNYTSSFPSAGTAAGFSDGTNMQGARVVDLDSGAGAVYGLVTNLVKRTSGGPTELIGQAAMAASLPVVISSDQSAVPVSGTITANLSATDNAVLDDIADGIAVTNAGTFVTQIDGAALTALQLIDNAISGAGFNITQLNGATVPIGAGVEATAVRVTLATDSTGVVSVDDNGSTLTVDGTVTVTDGSGALNTIVDSGTITTVSTVTNVATIGTSVTPGTAATNLGKAIQGTAGASDVGVATMAIRDDALTTLTADDGEWAALRVSSTGALHVTGGTGTTQYTEDAAATDGAALVAMGGIRRNTTPVSSADTAGDNAAINIDANGRVYTNTVLYDEAGTAQTLAVDYTQDAALTVGTTKGPLQMGRASATAPTNVSADNDAVMAWYLLNGSAVSNIAAGGTLITATSTSLNVACTTGCAGGTQFAEDIAHTTADAVTMAGTVRQDTKGTGLGANGDVANIYVNATGDVYTAAMGQVAHDAVGTSANPQLMGGYASQAAPTDVSADGDATRLWTLRNGSLVANLAAGGTLITATGAALNVSSTVTTFPDNEPFNVAQINGVAVSMGNGASGTGVQRVTIANDSTGILAAVTNVATIGTSVTPGTSAAHLGKAVDAVAGASDTGVLLLAVRDDALTTLTPVDGDYTQLRVSSTGALHVTGSSGTTQYVEDAAATDGASLVAVGGIRRDTTPSSSAGTAGDNATITLDGNGRLYTNTTLYDAAGTAAVLGTDYTQDAALTVGTTTGPMQMGRASAAAPTDASADNDAVMAWMLRNGSAVTNIAVGGTLITATSTSLNVACTSGCSGGTQYAEDAVHASGDTMTMAGVVRQDSRGTGIGANGDIAFLSVNGSGELYTTTTGAATHDAVAGSVNPLLIGGYASAAAPTDVSADGDATRIWVLRNGSQVSNLAAGGTLITATGTAVNVASSGTIAHDSADSGNPVKIGGLASSTAPTAVTANDRVNAWYSLNGAAYVVNPDPCSSGTKLYLPVNISTATTTEITPSLAGASTHYYVCSVNLVTAAANNVALVDDNTDGCGSVTAGLAGGTTAASGWNFAANGGLTLGNSMGSVMRTVTSNAVLCLVTSAATQLSGHIVVAAGL